MLRDLSSQRRKDAVKAFLGHRLTKQQLCQLVETAPGKWDDTFQRLTERGNDKAGAPSSGDIHQVVEELGLTKSFQELQDDEIWTSEERALYRTMAHFDALEVARAGEADSAASSSGFIETVKESFGDWDRNGDLRLDGSELDLAMAGGYYGEVAEAANTPEKASALVMLRRYEALLGSSDAYDGAGVTKSDMVHLEQATSGTLVAIRNLTHRTFREYLEKSEQIDPFGAIQTENFDPMGIRQGTPGSCVLLSTAATLEAESMSGMFEQLADGRIKVKFADGTSELVNPLTLAERLYHAKTSTGDQWPALLEIATAQKLYSEDPDRFDSLRDAIDGVLPEDAIKALTSKDTDQRELEQMSVNQTRKALQELTSTSGTVIAGSRPQALRDFINVEELDNGIMNGHAYSVLKFDPETDKVTLRNPWGHREWRHQASEDDGVFEMPVRDFYSSFRWIAAAV